MHWRSLEGTIDVSKRLPSTLFSYIQRSALQKTTRSSYIEVSKHAMRLQLSDNYQVIYKNLIYVSSAYVRIT